MNVVQAKAEIMRPHMTPEAIDAIYYNIVECSGVSYDNRAELTPEYIRRYVKERIKEGHESVIEHATMTVLFTIDRGISHELVRHRLASFTQSSTRYCNYSKNKFGNEITVIEPCILHEVTADSPKWIETFIYNWNTAILTCEKCYMNMVKDGVPPEWARTVLPNSLMTKVAVTANMREWRTIFKLRAAGIAGKPHPQMVEVMVPLLKQCQELMPEIFGDIEV